MRAELILEFAAKILIDKPTGCWLWQGSKNKEGYGQLGRQRAHRYIYTFYKGPIPAGFHVHHNCHVPACCNPDHLEALSRQEHHARHTHPQDAPTCKHGHVRTLETVYITPKGKLDCKICTRESMARSRVNTRLRLQKIRPIFL